MIRPSAWYPGVSALNSWSTLSHSSAPAALLPTETERLEQRRWVRGLGRRTAEIPSCSRVSVGRRGWLREALQGREGALAEQVTMRAGGRTHRSHEAHLSPPHHAGSWIPPPTGPLRAGTALQPLFAGEKARTNAGSETVPLTLRTVQCGPYSPAQMPRSPPGAPPTAAAFTHVDIALEGVLGGRSGRGSHRITDSRSPGQEILTPER